MHLWRGGKLWVRDKRLIVIIKQAGIEDVFGCYTEYKMKAVKMRIIIGAVIGGGIGFLVGYFGKCASGTCPFTSNPIVSTIIGALLGGLLASGK